MKKKSLFPLLLVALLLQGCDKKEDVPTSVIDKEEQKQPDPVDDPDESDDSEPYVNIDWETTTILSMDLTKGDVTLNFKEKAPSFVNGKSVIVLLTDTSANIRIVQNASVSGQTATLLTTEGNMTDIFMDQKFTLSTAIDNDTKTRSGNQASMDAGGVIHPIKIVGRKTDGSAEVLYDAKAASTRNIISDNTLRLFEKSWDYSGKVLKSWAHSRLLWETCTWSASLDGRFYFDFGAVEKEQNGIKIMKGELLSFFYILDGNIEADFLLKYVAEASDRQSEDIELAPFGPYNFIFTVGGIPVVITLDGNLMAEAVLEAKGKIELSGGFKTGVDTKIAVAYYSADETIRLDLPETVVNPYFELHKPTLTAEADLGLKVSVYPRLNVKLFNFAGPYMEPRPYMADDFKGKIRTVLGTGDNNAGWTNRLSMGMDFHAGLMLNFIGKSVQTPPLTVQIGGKTTLFEHPTDIKLKSPDNGSEYDVNTTISNITFEVTGTDFVQHAHLAPLAIVKFEPSSGTVDKKYAIADINGSVSVNWTPDKKDATLTAIIQDEDGEIISSATFTPKLKEFSIVGRWNFLQAGIIYREDGEFVSWSIYIVDFYPNGTFIHDIYHTDGTHIARFSGTYQLEGTSLLRSAKIIWLKEDWYVTHDSYIISSIIEIISNDVFLWDKGCATCQAIRMNVIPTKSSGPSESVTPTGEVKIVGFDGQDILIYKVAH